MKDNYHSLEIFKYENPEADINKEYQSRYNLPTTYQTNLKINPMASGIRLSTVNNLFMVPSKKVLNNQDQISQNSKNVIQLVSELPGIAKDQLIFNTLLSEIKSTNDIESVQTTNKEISDAISSAQRYKTSKKRLHSFATMYLNIMNDKSEKILELNDIRKIYDELLNNEISDEKLPDGKIFRNKYARIGNDLKTVHIPKDNESEIVSDLKDWIQFINSDDIPFLMKAFIAHYFLEYVHPFNDGNGRLGRYIVCVYLGHKLDSLSAITFSSQINKSKSKYYKAFEKAGNVKNYGEMTFFVNSMMDIFRKGQESLIESLKNKKTKLEYFTNCLDEKIDSKDERKILFIYIQSYLFDDFNNGIEDRDIKRVISNANYPDGKIHWTSAKRTIDDFVKKGILKTLKRSPYTRNLSDDFINNLTK